MASGRSIVLGGLAPLSEPGLVLAGQELVAGMTLAVERLNAEGGHAGPPIELRIMDTKGTPAAGVGAAARLRRDGAHALVGEYHSVVAVAVARESHRLKIPFVCASATLDTITAERLPFVFRLAPPQSYGWRVYAKFLLEWGARHVVAAIQPDIYWSGGAAILEAPLEQAGAQFTTVPVQPPTASKTLAADLETLSRRDPAPDVVLLLVGGYPEPLASIMRELRITSRNVLPAHLLLGDPAGRPALPDWWQVAGPHASGVPFLAYEQPGTRSGEGRAMEAAFEERHRRRPSFVALEGYDAVLALAHAATLAGNTDPDALCAALRELEVEGTRARIRFSTEPTGVVHQQWKWPPVTVLVRRYPGKNETEFELLWQAGGD